MAVADSTLLRSSLQALRMITMLDDPAHMRGLAQAILASPDATKALYPNPELPRFYICQGARQMWAILDQQTGNRLPGESDDPEEMITLCEHMNSEVA